MLVLACSETPPPPPSPLPPFLRNLLPTPPLCPTWESPARVLLPASFRLPAAGRSHEQGAGAVHEQRQSTDEVLWQTGPLRRSLRDRRSAAGRPRGVLSHRRFGRNHRPDPSVLLGAAELRDFRYRGHFRYRGDFRYRGHLRYGGDFRLGQGRDGMPGLHGGGGRVRGSGLVRPGSHRVRHTGGAAAAVRCSPS